MLECLQCNDLFKQTSKELFCCFECRTKFWKNNRRRINTSEHLEDIKVAVEKVRADAKNLKWHFDRLENDFSDWEDRCVAIDNIIRQLEEEVGLEEKELDNTKQNIDVNFDVMDDLLGIDNQE